MVLSLGIEPRFATSQAAVLSIERQERLNIIHYYGIKIKSFVLIRYKRSHFAIVSATAGVYSNGCIFVDKNCFISSILSRGTSTFEYC